MCRSAEMDFKENRESVFLLFFFLKCNRIVMSTEQCKAKPTADLTLEVNISQIKDRWLPENENSE